jgi:hypothetical protein
MFTTGTLKAQDGNFNSLLKANDANFYSNKVLTNYNSVLAGRFRDWNVIKISSDSIASKLTDNSFTKISIGLQVNSQMAFNLVIESNPIVSDNYILTTQTLQGKITSQPRLNYFYKGSVQNTTGSDVRLCIKEGFIYGYIRKDGKEFFIEPLNRYSKNALKDEFVFYESTDVIATAMSCGFNDAQAATKNVLDKPIQNQRPISPDSSGNPICKKVKFLIASDYSMYKSFNNDIDALETFLIANLNMAEGLFNTLNLDSTKAGDVGNDLLKFEVTQVHTSSCDSCDFMGTQNLNTNEILEAFTKWLDKNSTYKQAFINQFWSTRELEIGVNKYLGVTRQYQKYPDCFTSSMNLIKYFTQAPITLRLQVAHEAGHSFGCPHDNEMKSSVTGFIMNASGTYSPSGRFSQLSDFGGINYSSHQMIGATVTHSPCFIEYSQTGCEAITGLKISYYKSSDSINISWIGAGQYLIKYKPKDSITYNPVDEFTVTGTEVILRHLRSCTNYTLQVQKLCTTDNRGMISSTVFMSSPFTFTSLIANIRGNLYDLKLNVDCENCEEKNILVNIDQHPYSFFVNHFPSTVLISNLSADGATHRLYYNGDSVNGGCQTLRFFKAPYYREKSVKILAANFDSCIIGSEWRDSTANVFPGYNPRSWGVARYPSEINNVHAGFYKGNFDSTCMLINASGTGTLALISKVHDISDYADVYLSFDYKYLSFVRDVSSSLVKSFFKVQAFDGTYWKDLFEINRQIYYATTYLTNRSMWDTIPERVFIKLDQIINSKFQVRFVVDDGAAFINSGTGLAFSRQFLYLDNIKIDAYFNTQGQVANSFSIFPNPTGTHIFIRPNFAISDNIQFVVVDCLGRKILWNKLTHYHIDVSTLSSGVYFLLLFRDGGQIGKTIKLFITKAT